jgi:hypothetical protein
MAWSGQTVAAVAGRRLERGVRPHRVAARGLLETELLDWSRLRSVAAGAGAVAVLRRRGTRMYGASRAASRGEHATADSDTRSYRYEANAATVVKVPMATPRPEAS